MMPELYDITILWNANTEVDLDYYKVYYSAVSGGPYTLAGTTKSTAFIHKDIPEGTTLYYVISAVDKTGLEGLKSAQIVKTSPPDTTAPPAPTYLVARGTTDWSGVELFWNDAAMLDTKGYIIWRSFDGSNYDIIGTTTKPYYKDSNIPLHLDKTYGDTTVLYAVSAYDKYMNISASAGPTDPFSIPTLQNIKASIDYLSLNITWNQPRPEDDVFQVEVSYKKKTDVAWTIAEVVDWPTSKARIDGPLLEDTEYDVALKIYYGVINPITGVGIDNISITGDHRVDYPVWHCCVITGSGSQNGPYMVSLVGYNGTATTIKFTTNLPAYIAPPGFAQSKNWGFQANWLRVVMPNYDADVTPPTTPDAATARADPDNDRVYVTWRRVTIDDDFLYYKVEVSTGPSYVIVGKTNDENFILNNAHSFVASDSLVHFRITAVDRAGNNSTGITTTCPWYDAQINDGTGAYLPSGLKYVQPKPGTGVGNGNYDINMMRYYLIWKDKSRAAKYFDRYVVLFTYAAKAAATPRNLFTSWTRDMILKEINASNQVTLDMIQASWVVPSVNSLYFGLAVVDKFGNYYLASNTDAFIEVITRDATT